MSANRTAITALLLLPLLGANAEAQPSLDAYGDPLPSGALLRLGTIRLRPGGNVRSLAFSADGTKLITANPITGVHVWEVSTGKPIAHFAGIKDDPKLPPSPYASQVVAPGGRYIAQLDNRGDCTVLAVPQGKEVFKLASGIAAHAEPWRAFRLVRFSQDGKLLAVMRTTKVDVHEITTGKLKHSLPCTHAVNGFASMSFTPNGKALALSALNHLVVHDLASGEELTSFGNPQTQSGYGACTLAPDGKVLATFGKYFNQLVAWDLATRKPLLDVQAQFGWADQVTFTPDCRWIITNRNSEGTVEIWDVQAGKLLHRLPDWHARWSGLAVSPDKKTLATVDAGIIELWDLAKRKPLHDRKTQRGAGLNVEFSRDGKMLLTTSVSAVSGDAGSAVQWDALTGKQVKNFTWPGGSWPAGAVSTDGRILASGRQGELITVRALGANKTLLELDEQFWAPQMLALTPDGKYLMVQLLYTAPGGAYAQKLQLWDVPGRNKLVDLQGSDQLGGWLDPRGKTFIAVRDRGERRRLTCYDIATGRKLPRASLMPVAEGSRALSPGHRLLAEVHGRPGNVIVRELASNQTLYHLPTQGHTFRALAFSPTGRLLAGACQDGAVLVWDMIDGEVFAESKRHQGAAMSLSWSPDGTRLASGSADLSALVWDASPWLKRVPSADRSPTFAELQPFWRDLASVSASTGYRAINTLLRTPKETVAFLRKHLQGAPPPDVARLLKDLDSDQFIVRQKAATQLEKLGDLAQPALEKARITATTLELRRRIDALLEKLDQPPLSSACLQQIRALSVLELLDTAEAHALIDALGKGDPDAWLTRQAQAVTNRLKAP